MPQDDEELQDRVCRACNQTYKYPVLKSMATRFYCEDCVDLPPAVRASFERFNKRIRALSAAVQKLEHKLNAPGGANVPKSN